MNKEGYKNISIVVLLILIVTVAIYYNTKSNRVLAEKDRIEIKYNEAIDRENKRKNESEEFTLENLHGLWIGASKKDDRVKIYHISSFGDNNDILIKSREVKFSENGSSMADSILDLRSGYHTEFLINRSSEIEPSIYEIGYDSFGAGVIEVDYGNGFAQIKTGGKRDYVQIYVGGNDYYHMAKLNSQDLDPNVAAWSNVDKETFYKEYVIDETGLDYGGDSEKLFVETLQKYYD